MGNRQDSEQTTAVAKAAQSKAHGVRTKWDPKCKEGSV